MSRWKMVPKKTSHLKELPEILRSVQTILGKKYQVNKGRINQCLGQIKEDSYEALENYDLATSWMESDGDKEVVRK